VDVPQLKPLLAAALEAAQAAEVPIRRYFRASDIGLVSKADGSPVTRADREAEAAIRARLAAAPGGPFDVLGEEEGLAGGGTRLRWVVDPIDGTRSFVRGMPLFGTMIGLEDTADGSALLGVIHLPILGVTYAGGQGLGATRNGHAVRLPESVALEESLIGTGDIAQFDEAGMHAEYEQLIRLHGYVRGYTDCFGHGLAIEGALGAMVDPALNPWDICATQAIVEAAGGAVVVRPSRAAGKFDAVLGNRALVRRLAGELGLSS
jgi:histidinol phosphatase-like enzyme (inositol monophosphatase family)